MKNNLLFKLSKTLVYFAISTSINAQINPMYVDCPVNSFYPTDLSGGNNGGQVYPTVSVSTLNNCYGYLVVENYSWLSYSKNGLNVTFTMQANTGPARTGYVWIGDSDGPLTVTQACGGNPSTAGTITGNNSICPGQTGVSYSVGVISGATGYSWTLPSGATIASNNGNSITVDFSTSAVSGNISVRGTNSCGFGNPSPGYPVTVNTVTTAIGSNSPVCHGQTINLTCSGGSIYSWDGPNNFTSSLQNPSISNATIVNVGAYRVTVTNTSGCSSRTTTNVSVNSFPTPTATSNSPICSGGSINLSSTGGGSYSWSGPNGFSSTLQNPSISNSITSMSGTYSVNVTSSNGCISQASASVTVNSIPIPTALSNSPVCSGGTINLSSTGGGSYSWSGPNGFSSTLQNPSISNSITGMSGTYTVNVTNSNGCISQASASVTVNSIPIPTALSNSPLCSGGTINLSSSGGGSYSWSGPNGFNSTLQNPSIVNSTLSMSGTYSVTVTNSNGCSSLASVSVAVIPTLTATIAGGTTPICYNNSPGTFTAIASGGTGSYSYAWYKNGGFTGLTESTYNPGALQSTSSFYCSVTSGSCGTVNTSVTTIMVIDLPTITTHPSNSTVAPNQDATFSVTATGPNLQYQWQSSLTGTDNWTDLSALPAIGFNTPNLTIPGSPTVQTRYYRCYITSDCGNVFSNYGVLTTNIPQPGYYTGNEIPDPETRVINLGYQAGTTNSAGSVNASGAAAYSIPLDLSSGVNGLAPNISITYSSNGGSGIIGYGWNIGGLSSINRGPQTIYNDGVREGVSLSSSDRFYLDGQRLIPTSGNYGEENTTYQTENDIFTRVLQKSTDVNGPAWFKAETKSGLMCEYGNTAESKQKLNDIPQVLNWYVSKIDDQFGNAINFKYIQDHNSIYPAEITYGPNTITFNYKSRNDKNPRYLKDKKIESWLLLDKINIKYNSNLIKTYEFKYSYQGSSYYSSSLLNEIIEYGIGSSRYNSTVFSYSIPTDVSFPMMVNHNNDYITYTSKLFTGDFNGDGKSDFLSIPDAAKGATWTGLKAHLSSGNGSFLTTFSSSIEIDLELLSALQIIDLNSDGFDDILYEYPDTVTFASDFFYILSHGNYFDQPVQLEYDGFSGFPGFYNFENAPLNQMQADYNGDGSNDVFLYDDEGNWIILSFVNSSGEMTSGLNVLSFGSLNSPTFNIRSGDFNGDGKSDIWVIVNSGIRIYTFDSTLLKIIYNNQTGFITSDKYFTLGDFNSDGKSDILIYGSFEYDIPVDYLNWEIHLGTGSGFEQHNILQKRANLKDDKIQIGDFNGDGATDLMVTDLYGAHFYISMNDGTDFYDEFLDYSFNTENMIINDYDGDGKSDLICIDDASPWWSGYNLFQTVGSNSVVLQKTANGLGALTKFNYTKLSVDTTVYEKGAGATYPVSDYQGPWNVVSSVEYDNGLTMNTKEYNYKAAKMHLQGKGFLGFMETNVKDIAANVETRSTYEYDNSYFYPKLVNSSSRLLGSPELIEENNYVWQNKILDLTNKRLIPYIHTVTQTNNLIGHSITSSTEYNDDYGNPTFITKSYSNGPTESITNIYNNTVSGTKWLLGRPESTTTQYSDNDTTIIRSVSRVFDPDNTHLTSETWFAGTNNSMTKSYLYYPNGSLQTETVTANGVSRSSGVTYESDNISVHTITDQLSHLTTNTFDAYGRLQTQEDFLGNTMTFEYDNLGRQISTSSSLGSAGTTVYSMEDPSVGPLLSRYSIQTTGNDGSLKKNWYDKLGRCIQSDVKGFDGSLILTATNYNNKGQIESVSEPHFSTESLQWNTFDYDNYGRKISLITPSGRNTSWSYSSNSITETTSGKSTTKTYSSSSNILSSTDNGGTISYLYYPDGKSKSISAPGGIITRMYYDVAGNQKKLVDPSAGTITYSYNGFGELTSQVMLGPKTTIMSYHPDGRISQKSEAGGITKYRYSINEQISNISSPDGVSRSYIYYQNGRAENVIDTIPGSAPFSTAYTYDPLGRLQTITHPSGIVETNIFNANGYLNSYSIDEVNLWTITGMNSRQQLTSSQYGIDLNASFNYDSFGDPESIVTGTIQNYSYNFNPITGNLNWRSNNKYSGLREDFQYDNLDRLRKVYMDTTLILEMKYESDNAGLTSKNDIGTILYETPGKPYALSGINPITGIVPISDQVLTYNAFGSISTITEGNNNAVFLYSPDNDRSRMTILDGSNTVLVRWYSSSGDIREASGGVTKDYTFIGGDAYTAPVVAITSSGTTNYYNLLRDHLGSITHVVNSSTKEIVAEYSFDAWGRMRDPSTWTNYDPGSEPELLVAGRGFTGHEHLPWFNLINMNGRVYDPLIGMFLSPDNYVQNTGFTQSFNRYGYCLNNPLSSTDPSGMLVAGPEYNSSIDALDQYFNWMTDITRIWQISSGGGGGGSNSGFHSFRGGNVYDEVNSLIKSPYGGLWSSSSGAYYYTSQDEAFITSSFFIEANNSWNTTIGGDFNSAINAYDGGRLATEIMANNPEFLTASFGGGGPNTISIQNLAPKQNFNGFWGGVKYFMTGGNIDGYHYKMDGKVMGFAPITGMAPTPGIKGSSIRSTYQKSIYLRGLGESGKLPKWMNQWVKNGKVPPGYQVDHKIPISIGGQDVPSNMRLNQTLNHWMHHIFYHPWRP